MTAGIVLRLLVLVGIALAPRVAVAQPAWITNARLETMAAGADLGHTVTAKAGEAVEPMWIGYAVPQLAGDRFHCDWSVDSRRDGSVAASRDVAAAVKLEGATTLYVLIRAEAGIVSRVRFFSEGCRLDAGGLTLVWTTGVAPEASVGLLERLLAETSDRRVADGALAALAMHDTPSAVTSLLSLARQGPTPRLRGQALFWVAQRAGDRAAPAIGEAIERDPDLDVKRRALFALSQLPAGEGVPRLIEVAERHSSRAVRRQAMFWLGQSNDPRALAFFERILLK